MLFMYEIMKPGQWLGDQDEIVERGQFDWPYAPPVGYKVWVGGQWYVVKEGKIVPTVLEKITTLVLYPAE